MKRLLLLLFSCVLFLQPYCQAQPLTSEESPVTLSTATGDIKGRLLLPANATTCPVVLLIAGSGPTDMDGNNPMMKNNSLKFLAEGLAQKGIASLRFDKRGIASRQRRVHTPLRGLCKRCDGLDRLSCQRQTLHRHHSGRT